MKDQNNILDSVKAQLEHVQLSKDLFNDRTELIKLIEKWAPEFATEADPDKLNAIIISIRVNGKVMSISVDEKDALDYSTDELIRHVSRQFCEAYYELLVERVTDLTSKSVNNLRMQARAATW